MPNITPPLPKPSSSVPPPKAGQSAGPRYSYSRPDRGQDSIHDNILSKISSGLLGEKKSEAAPKQSFSTLEGKLGANPEKDNRFQYVPGSLARKATAKESPKEEEQKQGPSIFGGKEAISRKELGRKLRSTEGWRTAQRSGLNMSPADRAGVVKAIPKVYGDKITVPELLRSAGRIARMGAKEHDLILKGGAKLLKKIGKAK